VSIFLVKVVAQERVETVSGRMPDFNMRREERRGEVKEGPIVRAGGAESR
jgi:hypothetical protein